MDLRKSQATRRAWSSTEKSDYKKFLEILKKVLAFSEKVCYYIQALERSAWICAGSSVG